MDAYSPGTSRTPSSSPVADDESSELAAVVAGASVDAGAVLSTATSVADGSVPSVAVSATSLVDASSAPPASSSSPPQAAANIASDTATQIILLIRDDFIDSPRSIAISLTARQ